MRKELLIAALGIGVSGTLDAATRQEVDRLLDKIAKSPPPENLSFGAMCYATIGPPMREEYVCPVCGTKTLYTSKEERKGFYEIVHVFSYREQCETLRKLGWDVKLDESFLCSKCRKPEQSKDFFIVVTIDGKTTRTKMQRDDLTKLIAFAKKERVWKTRQDMEIPLKKELPRIRELLGMPATETEKDKK